MSAKEELLERLLDSISAELYNSEWKETEQAMRNVLSEYTIGKVQELSIDEFYKRSKEL